MVEPRSPLLEGQWMELMGELAYPIPLAVIAELFDVGLEGAEVLAAETRPGPRAGARPGRGGAGGGRRGGDAGDALPGPIVAARRSSRGAIC